MIRLPAETPGWRAKYDAAQGMRCIRPFVYRARGRWYLVSEGLRPGIEPLRDANRSKP